MFALGAILRGLWGYFSLIFIARVVGRRPGKQYTPFEFVLIFFLGGLTLTGMVGPEASSTNAVIQILAIAAGHTLLVWVRMRFPAAKRLLDGIPLVLLEGNTWRSRTMRQVRVTAEDVLYTGRDNGLATAEEIHTATLERNGEISVIPAEES
jgi:uncharacterized membrane protein YcaP (DUF421 family)